MEFTTPIELCSSGVTGFLTFACFAVLPLVIWNILHKNQVTAPYFEEKYGTLSEGLQERQWIVAAFNQGFLLRRVLTVFILVSLRDYPGQQLQLLFLTSLSN